MGRDSRGHTARVGAVARRLASRRLRGRDVRVGAGEWRVVEPGQRRDTARAPRVSSAIADAGETELAGRSAAAGGGGQVDVRGALLAHRARRELDARRVDPARLLHVVQAAHHQRDEVGRTRAEVRARDRHSLAARHAHLRWRHAHDRWRWRWQWRRLPGRQTTAGGGRAAHVRQRRGTLDEVQRGRRGRGRGHGARGRRDALDFVGRRRERRNRNVRFGQLLRERRCGSTQRSRRPDHTLAARPPEA